MVRLLHVFEKPTMTGLQIRFSLLYFSAGKGRWNHDTAMSALKTVYGNISESYTKVMKKGCIDQVFIDLSMLVMKLHKFLSILFLH